MKAYALKAADRPAEVTSLPKPEVGETSIRIAVRAASLNAFDVFQANGFLFGVMEHALPTVVGRDFAGLVEAIGSDVESFAVGDEVFGFIPSTPPLKSGAFAEFVAGGSELVLAHTPAGLDVFEAAALPLAGSAALDLLEAIVANPGDVVLIAGATGGVGSFAVQLAAQRGLVVIATARPDKDAFVRELGAAETVDYTAGRVADTVRSRHPDGIAAIIDVVDRGEALLELAAVVQRGGHVASLLGAVDSQALASQGVVGHNVNAAPTVEKLRLLGELASSGKLRVPIQGIYSIAETGEALQAFQRGTRGKLVLRVDPVADEDDRRSAETTASGPID
jgi:NADPH:quinone reductase-like Zn-dependent oxidoreductase